jgi:hypothetical protein
MTFILSVYRGRSFKDIRTFLSRLNLLFKLCLGREKDGGDLTRAARSLQRPSGRTGTTRPTRSRESSRRKDVEKGDNRRDLACDRTSSTVVQLRQLIE